MQKVVIKASSLHNTTHSFSKIHQTKASLSLGLLPSGYHLPPCSLLLFTNTLVTPHLSGTLTLSLLSCYLFPSQFQVNPDNSLQQTFFRFLWSLRFQGPAPPTWPLPDFIRTLLVSCLEFLNSWVFLPYPHISLNPLFSAHQWLDHIKTTKTFTLHFPSILPAFLVFSYWRVCLNPIHPLEPRCAYCSTCWGQHKA